MCFKIEAKLKAQLEFELEHMLEVRLKHLLECGLEDEHKTRLEAHWTRQHDSNARASEIAFDVI